MHVVSLINNNTHLYPKRVLYCLIEHDKMLYVDVELFMHGYKCQTDLCDGVIIKLYCAMGILYKKKLAFPVSAPLYTSLRPGMVTMQIPGIQRLFDLFILVPW